MASVGLVGSTWVAGPEEAKSAADAYSVNPAGKAVVLEKVDYKLSGPTSPVGVSIKQPSIPGLKANPVTTLKAVSATGEIVLARVAANTPSIRNCFGSLDDYAKKLMKIPGDLGNAVTATINGITSKVKGLADKLGNLSFGFGNLQGIGCVTNNLTGGQFSLNVTDKGGLSGLIAGTSLSGSAMGINNIFSTISKSITDKDTLLGACKNMLPAATKDFGLLKDLASVSSISGNLKSMLPSISGNSISNFRIQPGTTSMQMPSLFNDMKSTLNRIDSSWNNVTRDGETILSAIPLASPKAKDFNEVMKTSVMSESPVLVDPDPMGPPAPPPTTASDEAHLLAISGSGETTPEQCLKKDFPTVPVETPVVQTEPIVAPSTPKEEAVANSTTAATNDGRFHSSFTTTWEGDIRTTTITSEFSDGHKEVKVKKYDKTGAQIDGYKETFAAPETPPPPAPVIPKPSPANHEDILVASRGVSSDGLRYWKRYKYKGVGDLFDYEYITFTGKNYTDIETESWEIGLDA